MLRVVAMESFGAIELVVVGRGYDGAADVECGGQAGRVILG